MNEPEIEVVAVQDHVEQQASSAKFVPMEVVESMKQLGRSTLEDAKLMPVATQEDYEIAMTFRRKIKEHIERGNSIMNPVCVGLYKAHQNAVALRNEITADCKAADDILDGRMKEFTRQRRAEQERIAAQQLAEAKRLEQENKDRLAKELEKAGEPEKAEQVRQAPTLVHAPTPPKLVPQGVRQLWKVKTVDVVELGRFVVDNPLFSHYLTSVDSALLDYKRDNPKAEIPGVTFEQVDSISVKR